MIRAAALLTLLAAPAAAQVAACQGALPFDDTVAALEEEGWTVHRAADPLPDAAVERLAWALAATYLGGDRGGETTEAIVALQRRSVPGLARKRDTDTTRSRTLLRGDGALILTDTQTGPGRVERSCRIATDAPVPPGPGVSAVDGAAFDGAPRGLAETRVAVDTLR